MPAALDVPTLRTERLVLRPLQPSDAAPIRELAGAREIAANTLTIPHPYEEGMAETWIAEAAAAATRGEKLVLAVTTDADGLVGTAGLDLQPDHRRAELGYWIGIPYWGRGFATEAARAVVDHGFGQLGLHRIYARVFPHNPASGRVLEKLGMRHEGRLRGHILKWGEFEDVESYGILSTEWRSVSGGSEE